MADLSGTELQANSDRWHAMGAGFLGWTLDAFDFFVVIFLLDTLAAHFHVSKRDIVLTITAPRDLSGVAAPCAIALTQAGGATSAASSNPALSVK